MLFEHTRYIKWVTRKRSSQHTHTPSRIQSALSNNLTHFRRQITYHLVASRFCHSQHTTQFCAPQRLWDHTKNLQNHHPHSHHNVIVVMDHMSLSRRPPSMYGMHFWQLLLASCFSQSHSANCTQPGEKKTKIKNLTPAKTLF